MAEGEKPIIKAESVVKSFHIGEADYEVLHGISVDIVPGSFIIIYGPSGSGKSTFLNCLIGLDTISKGKISVFGSRLDQMNEDERSKVRSEFFGVVHQQPIWVKSLSVVENVALPLMIQGSSNKEASGRAMQFLKQVGMDKYAKRRPTEISGGEQQRVSLARALIHDPKILVLDEPTGNLDTHSADEVMGLLQSLNIQEKRTIIMVTHNLIYLPYASQTIDMKDGLINQDSQTQRLTSILEGTKS
ncbi:MAG: ABC transporter ATP-binding protein [bacterium]|nr:ABC transporter ATP-binding protein [bacterium]